MLRTDGKENLITAIEIAAARENDMPLVPEVCIFFENDLLRGNRTSKTNADNFNAFRSYNYPPLHMPVFRLSMMSPRFTIGIPETAETSLLVGPEYCNLENISWNFSAGCGKHLEYSRLERRRDGNIR